MKFKILLVFSCVTFLTMSSGFAAAPPCVANSIQMSNGQMQQCTAGGAWGPLGGAGNLAGQSCATKGQQSYASSTGAPLYCNSSTWTDMGWATTNGTDIYHTGGNVGIGTTIPSFKLHTVGAASDAWASRFDAGSTYVYLANGNGYGTYIDAGPNASAGTYAMYVNKQGVPYLFVRGDGNVGIGNVAGTQAKLEVSGSILSGAASANAGCSPLGAQAHDAGTGAPLYCANTGVWTAVGSQFGGMYQTSNRSFILNNPLTGAPSCPPGFTSTNVMSIMSYYWFNGFISDQTRLYLCWK